MKCSYCDGQLVRGRASYTVARPGYHLTLNDIPAWVCNQCGQPVFGDEQSATLQEIIDRLDASAERLRQEWRT